MIAFVDTSIVLRILLGERQALTDWQNLETVYGSLLLRTESRRRLSNARLMGVYNDIDFQTAIRSLVQIERNLTFAPLTESVLNRAGGPFQTSVGTLDAIHLATALLIRERGEPDLVFATHDREQAGGAVGLGFEVIGVDL